MTSADGGGTPAAFSFSAVTSGIISYKNSKRICFKFLARFKLIGFSYL